jgi:hypothetical protein
MGKRGVLILVAVVALGCAAHAADLQMNGLVQTQYVDEGNAVSQYLVKAARLKVQVPIANRVTGRFQADFARDPLILDATIDFKVNDYATFTAGQFKIPFGYDFQLPRFYLETIERSLIMKKVFANGASSPYVRDVGVMVNGRFKLINYEVATVNGTGYNYYGEDAASVGVFPKWYADNNNTKDLVGRVGIGVPLFAGLGFSIYEGEWASDKDRSAWDFYFHVDTGKVIFQYEYVRGEGYLGTDEWMANKYSGYYVIVGYRVIPLIQPTFKVDKFDPNRSEGDDKLTDYYYGLNFNYERTARLQVFYRDSKKAGDFAGKGWRAQVSVLY